MVPLWWDGHPRAASQLMPLSRPAPPPYVNGGAHVQAAASPVTRSRRGAAPHYNAGCRLLAAMCPMVLEQPGGAPGAAPMQSPQRHSRRAALRGSKSQHQRCRGSCASVAAEPAGPRRPHLVGPATCRRRHVGICREPKRAGTRRQNKIFAWARRLATAAKESLQPLNGSIRVLKVGIVSAAASGFVGIVTPVVYDAHKVTCIHGGSTEFSGV